MSNIKGFETINKIQHHNFFIRLHPLTNSAMFYDNVLKQEKNQCWTEREELYKLNGEWKIKGLCEGSKALAPKNRDIVGNEKP